MIWPPWPIFTKGSRRQTVSGEASHVIVDEAQDFGMIGLWSAGVLPSGMYLYNHGRYLSRISISGYGLNDWDGAWGNCCLQAPTTAFRCVKKSYRNTVEISRLATEIPSAMETSPVYLVEPVRRHGKEVSMVACKGEKEQIEKTVKILKKCAEEGRETIGGDLPGPGRNQKSQPGIGKTDLFGLIIDPETARFDRGDPGAAGGNIQKDWSLTQCSFMTFQREISWRRRLCKIAVCGGRPGPS